MPYTEAQLRKHREAMKRGEALAVILETHEQQQAPGTIQLLRLSEAERSGRAVRWLLTFFAIAPVSAIFPPHLLWPLAMTTVGVVGFFLRRGRSEIVLGGEARCPRCQAFQLLDAGSAEFPMAHFCTECRKRSLVRLDPASAPSLPPPPAPSAPDAPESPPPASP